MTIIDCRHHLPEEVPSFLLRQSLALTNVIIKISFAGIFHHNDNLATVFKYYINKNREEIRNNYKEEF